MIIKILFYLNNKKITILYIYFLPHNHSSIKSDTVVLILKDFVCYSIYNQELVLMNQMSDLD
jgi:hypothetical protein